MNDDTKRFLIKFFVAVTILVIAIFTVIHFKKNKPKVKKKDPVSITPVVTVMPVKAIDHQTVVEAMGTVIPAREVTIRSRVTGEVVKIHPDFLEGGFIQKGEILAKLDDTDYKIAKIQSEANVVKSESELAIEKGQQDIAKREWELIGPDKSATQFDQYLALRVPQLKTKQANLDVAKNALQKAKIDIGRTTIKAPFNSLILSADVQIGDQANSQTQMAKLVGTDTFHIQASLPVSKLNWFTIPSKKGEDGAEVTVIAKGNRKFQGQIVKLLGDIEPNGRMARVLVKVKDPLNLKGDGSKRLLLGEYVNLLINGKVLENVVKIPRTAFHKNSEIWALTKENSLKTLKATPVWEERKDIFISNSFGADDKLITSELTFPVEGMKLNIFTEREVEND